MDGGAGDPNYVFEKWVVVTGHNGDHDTYPFLVLIPAFCRRLHTATQKEFWPFYISHIHFTSLSASWFLPCQRTRSCVASSAISLETIAFSRTEVMHQQYDEPCSYRSVYAGANIGLLCSSTKAHLMWQGEPSAPPGIQCQPRPGQYIYIYTGYP